MHVILYLDQEKQNQVGEVIIMLLLNYGNFTNVVTEDIIKHSTGVHRKLKMGLEISEGTWQICWCKQYRIDIELYMFIKEILVLCISYKDW